jgi:hypothetical protein
MRRLRGGCHCGRVRFEVEAPPVIEAHACNCSICTPLAYLHLIVPRSRFELLKGQESLVSYRFGTRTARHLFCGVCGIKAFYVPRSHPDGYSVNVRCLDGIELDRVRITPFDGANWEAHASELPPLPGESGP